MISDDPFFDRWIDDQPAATQKAMRRLRKAGLKPLVHFGYENAVQIEAEMDRAIQANESAKWFFHKLGRVD